MRKKINFNAISLIISILVICFTVSSYVFAVWQEPTAGPPGNNILPPINVSSTGQNKLGDFGIGGGSGQPVYWLSNYYGTLRFNSASPAGTRLVIGQDGNVGIGTTGPDNKFEVMGADSRSIRFDVNTNVDALRTVQLIFDNAENDATDALSVISSRLTNGSAGNATTDLAFEVSKLGTESEAMRINSSGNVGIGTTGPGAPLNVASASGIQARFDNTGAGQQLTITNSVQSGVQTPIISSNAYL